MIRRSTVPAHRWQAHSRFSGWITTSSGGRLAFSVSRTLALGQFGRNPMGAIEAFDPGISAPSEAQSLALRRPRDIRGLARQQPLTFRPGPEDLHRFGDARRVGLDGMLQGFDLPQPPALLGVAVSHPMPISTSPGATYSSIENAVSAALITRSASFGRFFVSMIERERNGQCPYAYQGVGQSVNAVAAASGEAGFHGAVAREAKKRRAISRAITPLESIGS
jgi:hypothetical protein